MKPEAFLKKTTHLAETLDKISKAAVYVGLPKEKVGSKIYKNGMSVVKIGIVHEYGGTINHPGGTPYIKEANGKISFVTGKTVNVTGYTKPHTIKIPMRSFLRIPFTIKSKEIKVFIAKQYREIFTEGKSYKRALDLIGIKAQTISQKAFTTNGYGTWKPDSAATIRAKGSSQTLIDKGILRGSITWVVRNR